MRAVVITPAEPLVTVDDAKIWAPVLGEDSEARVTALLRAAQAAIEAPNGWLGRALGMQVLEARFDCFRDPCLFLPYPPLREVKSLTYRDAAGEDQEVAISDLRVLGVGTTAGSIAPIGAQGWPVTEAGPEAVRVQYSAGYAAADQEAAPIRHAVVLAAVQLRALSTQDLSLRSRQTEGVGSRTWTVSEVAYQLVQRSIGDLLQPFRIYA
ncbi:hypothetical protein R1A27_20190 [Methylobacterium sp. NMS12]|uniref:hypothetical protein n=1 Tax=Methylobacterium sp. NMS12 TaxID=3079766 RepID=UPI003F88484B